MNNPSEFTPSTDASVEHVNRRATDSALTGNMSNAAAAGIFRRDISLAARYRMWRPWWQRHQEPDTENCGNNAFLAAFSHELRTSLGAIRSATGILRVEQSGGPAGVQARLLIERQVGHMTRLVEDLLDVSRIRNGQLRLQYQRIDLCAVVAHSVQTVGFTMQQHNHRMTASFPDAPLWLQADPARLEQVFVNLLVNAAKYTDAGGKIDLSVEQKGGEAVIRVRDTGVGIAPEILPNVFNLFVQVDPSSQRAEAGLGIGLALVHSLVESHGGRVTAASAGLGQGSEFTVHLPLCAAPIDSVRFTRRTMSETGA
jgi:signal transduction histidine kinase